MNLTQNRTLCQVHEPGSNKNVLRVPSPPSSMFSRLSTQHGLNLIQYQLKISYEIVYRQWQDEASITCG